MIHNSKLTKKSFFDLIKRVRKIEQDIYCHNIHQSKFNKRDRRFKDYGYEEEIDEGYNGKGRKNIPSGKQLVFSELYWKGPCYW